MDILFFLMLKLVDKLFFCPPFLPNPSKLLILFIKKRDCILKNAVAFFYLKYWYWCSERFDGLHLIHA